MSYEVLWEKQRPNATGPFATPPITPSLPYLLAPKATQLHRHGSPLDSQYWSCSLRRSHSRSIRSARAWRVSYLGLRRFLCGRLGWVTFAPCMAQLRLQRRPTDQTQYTSVRPVSHKRTRGRQGLSCSPRGNVCGYSCVLAQTHP